MKLAPVRIGPKYQADLPALLPQPERLAQCGNDGNRPPLVAATRYKQRWTPSRFTTDEVTEFLRSFCALHEAELGLQCLYESDFHVQRAVQLLHAARRARDTTQRAETERVSDDAFGSAIAMHGKKFFVIQHELASHVTTGDVIRRFYLWKTSSAYRVWRERAKARRSKESARLRASADSDDSDASDFHNEYCELCFTGGQLLCCDGCERAYHFSCVTPPIRDLPTGDWYCARCASTLEATTRVVPSAENPHCCTVEPLDGSGAEASDVETLDLEDIDDDDDDDDDEYVDDFDTVGAAVAMAHERSNASGTDDSESDSGGVAKTLSQPQHELEPRESARSDSHHITIKTEARAPRLQPSPAKVALALEPASNERKRKRKIGAPRRIPQLHPER